MGRAEPGWRLDLGAGRRRGRRGPVRSVGRDLALDRRHEGEASELASRAPDGTGRGHPRPRRAVTTIDVPGHLGYRWIRWERRDTGRGGHPPGGHVPGPALHRLGTG